MKKSQIGLQLWTIQAEVDRDYVGAFHKIAKLGYAGVEVGNFGPLSGAAEFKKLLDDTNLKCIAYHVMMDELMKYPQKYVDMCSAIGCKHLVMPIIEDAKRDGVGYKWLSTTLGDISRILNAGGIELSYHNHYWEFEKFDGVYGEDIVLDPVTSGRLFAELDVYWTKYANEDPVHWINKLGPRIRLLHIKDMENSPERFFCEVGYGTLDMPAIVAAGDKAGVEWYIVEQDATKRDCLETATMSYDYLCGLATDND